MSPPKYVRCMLSKRQLAFLVSCCYEPHSCAYAYNELGQRTYAKLRKDGLLVIEEPQGSAVRRPPPEGS